jgi:catechol 2,3-dioxygenase-like lactoylglutathione lyase family enzyme
MGELRMRISRLDHLVLTVVDIDAAVGFYTELLGMTAVTFGTYRRAASFGSTKINFHQEGREFEPKARRPTPGSADICLIVEDSIDALMAELAEAGVRIEEGPVQRTGALGLITSCYIRDLDNNLIELSNYPAGD